MKAYRKAESVIEDYLQGRKEPDPERKKSVLEELERIQKEQRTVPKAIRRSGKECLVEKE